MQYLSTRKQLDELIEEAHERPTVGVEKKPVKKQEKI